MNSNKISKEEYLAFLERKVRYAGVAGIDVDRSGIPELLKPHQMDAVCWLATGGRRALFSSFGTGKTIIQLQLAKQYADYLSQQLAAYCISTQPESFPYYNSLGDAQKCLIICPLAVVEEFRNDAGKLGIKIQYVRNRYEVLHSECDILVTNYERVRDGDIEAEDFAFVTLDEASAIRSLGSKTYLEYTKKFRDTPFKTVATATPAPNDYIELLNYAAFLGIMDVSQAKTRWFKRNSERADELTLMEGKEDEFWMWVFSWALFIKDPSSLGYPKEGYDLPKSHVFLHMIPDEIKDVIDEQGKVNTDRVSDRGQIMMYKKPARGLSTPAKYKRESVEVRVDKAMEIMGEASADTHWLLWHHLEREQKELDKRFKGDDGYVNVYGKLPEDIKLEGLKGFASGKYRVLGTKPEIAGQGCNFQRHCHNAIFLGINYKFNDFIQALHRIVRFLQEHECNIHIIYMESEQHILDELFAKWREHDELIERMEALVRQFGLNSIAGYEALKRTMGVTRVEVTGEDFTAVFNDTVLEYMQLEDECQDLQFSSWPFGKQYEYSASYHDVGHNETNEECFTQMDFLVPNLYRTLKPGRISAVHVKDRIIFGNFSGLGFPTVYEFSDEVVKCMKKHGFAYCGRITIATDVVRENSQTYRLGHTENGKDSTKMGCGMGEYVLLFRKPQTDKSKGYADKRVTKDLSVYTRGRWQIDAHGFWRSSGNSLLTPDEYAALELKYAMKRLKAEQVGSVYDYERHVHIAEAMDHADHLPTDYMAVPPYVKEAIIDDLAGDHMGIVIDDDVWSDITRMRGLNTMQGQRKEEQHLCPLPFDIVKRVITRWSNPGEVVADAFGGIFTVPYMAIELGRKGWACELNYEYWHTGVGYCKEKEYKRTIPSLFDSLKA